MLPQNIVPVFTGISPSSASPGGTVTITIRVNEVPNSTQMVDLSSSPSGAFVDLPAQVPIPSTTDTASFTATFAQSASGSVTVTSSCNGTERTSSPCFVAT